MKHCPECNFTFPDFHRVCDFDGTELVLDPERQSLMRVNPPPSNARPGLKRPMLLTSLAVLGLFLSAVLIGYLDSPAPSIPVIVKNQDGFNSPRDLTPTARTTEETTEIKKATEPSKSTVHRRRNPSAGAATARLRRKATAARDEVVARTENSKRPSSEKSPPKVVAILKTTWRVLKKPFDF